MIPSPVLPRAAFVAAAVCAGGSLAAVASAANWTLGGTYLAVAAVVILFAGAAAQLTRSGVGQRGGGGRPTEPAVESETSSAAQPLRDDGSAWVLPNRPRRGQGLVSALLTQALATRRDVTLPIVGCPVVGQSF